MLLWLPPPDAIDKDGGAPSHHQPARTNSAYGCLVERERTPSAYPFHRKFPGADERMRVSLGYREAPA